MPISRTNTAIAKRLLRNIVGRIRILSALQWPLADQRIEFKTLRSELRSAIHDYETCPKCHGRGYCLVTTSRHCKPCAGTGFKLPIIKE